MDKKNYRLPISTNEEYLKNLDYLTYGILTYFSSRNSDETNKRWIYKNTLISKQEEIEELIGIKFDTFMRNVRKLSKMNNELIVAKNSENGIVYNINYHYMTHGYYVLIHKKILKYILDVFDSNTLKVYAFLKYRCLKGKAKVTLKEIAEAIGLSPNSKDTLQRITNITVSMNGILIKKEYKYITEINEETGNEQAKRYCYYEIIKEEDVLKIIDEENGVSKGEKKIMDWLEKNNFKYIYDKPYFKDLLSQLGNPLRPDFILPDYKIWIEYDGQQHYKYGYFGEDLLDLMNLKYRDDMKNKYAKKKDWKLIRISYRDFNKVEQILKKEIINE